MTLRDLHYRLEHAGKVCTLCGTLYGDRVMRGTILREHGICHVCDTEGSVRPIEVFDHLRRGRRVVGRLAQGQFDETTILSLLRTSQAEPQKVA